MTDHDKWLTSLVEERFVRYDSEPTSRLLDELYVLIGALKVAGFETSYDAMRQELMERVRTHGKPEQTAAPDDEWDSFEELAEKPHIVPENLRDVLRGRVRGQDHVIESVVDRLAITRQGLDLRPHRPNGVFLFAGPTGVGKTELATQIAIAEYGGSDHLIRLDMSEYAEREFGVARLVGSAPGYAGHSEPSSWLTTRVRANPRSVILLDEIEKADPGVWSTFLQVFDSGRLTDGRGTTADFSETIVIMTSNLGAREASAVPAGFGDRLHEGATRQLSVIKAALSPELLNRIDEVILFDPLSMEAIEDIAESELAALVGRISSSGWNVEYDPDVPRWLAETGYDAAFGARHLQRNIEREFLGLLVRSGSRALRVAVRDARLVTV